MCLQSLPSPQHPSILDYWTGLCVLGRVRPGQEHQPGCGRLNRAMGVFRGAAHLADYRELAALHVHPVRLGLGDRLLRAQLFFVTVALTGVGSGEALRLHPGGQMRLYLLWVRRAVPVVRLTQNTSQAELYSLLLMSSLLCPRVITSFIS